MKSVKIFRSALDLLVVNEKAPIYHAPPPPKKKKLHLFLLRKPHAKATTLDLSITNPMSGIYSVQHETVIKATLNNQRSVFK